MLKPLYHWMLEKSRHPKAAWWLTGLSSLDSFVFPIPPDVMLLPMALAARDKALRFALYCTIGAVVGAAVGYGIGFFFFDTLGGDIIALYGKEDAFAEIQHHFQKYDWMVMIAAALTPIPFKIATITAGFVQSNFVTFILAAIIGRGLRYGLISLLIVLFGARIEYFIDRYFTLLVTFGAIVFLAGWALVLW